jgi:hypothetical protein
MALAAIPVLPAAPPAPPIFRFADGPPPNEVWAPGMAADPLLQVDADESFAAYAASYSLRGVLAGGRSTHHYRRSPPT